MIASGNFGCITQIFHHRLWTSKGFWQNNPGLLHNFAEFVLFYGLLALSFHTFKTFDKALQGTEIYRPFGCFTIALFINSATRNNAMQVDANSIAVPKCVRPLSFLPEFLWFC
jgi:hypothetical protein